MAEQEAAPSITIAPNGPYIVQGGVPVSRRGGEALQGDQTRYALCRCGGSETKPFCDGTHASNGFSDG